MWPFKPKMTARNWRDLIFPGVRAAARDCDMIDPDCFCSPNRDGVLLVAYPSGKAVTLGICKNYRRSSEVIKTGDKADIMDRMCAFYYEVNSDWYRIARDAHDT